MSSVIDRVVDTIKKPRNLAAIGGRDHYLLLLVLNKKSEAHLKSVHRETLNSCCIISRRSLLDEIPCDPLFEGCNMDSHKDIPRES